MLELIKVNQTQENFSLSTEEMSGDEVEDNSVTEKIKNIRTQS